MALKMHDAFGPSLPVLDKNSLSFLAVVIAPQTKKTFPIKAPLPGLCTWPQGEKGRAW